MIELLVVVIIIGILVGIAIPQYSKTLETSKATDAAAQLALIANANRMFALDHNGKYAGYDSGRLTNSCNGGTCDASCSGNTPPACCLVTCRYLATADWDGKPYNYFVLNKSPGSCTVAACGGGAAPSANVVACAARVQSTDPVNPDRGTDAVPYISWGYVQDTNGVIGCFSGDTPAPPK